MPRRSGTSSLAAIVVLCLTALAGPASGQDAARGAPGRFDFYVLSLSWSRIDHRLVSSMMDLMPAPHLIFNEWDKHGTRSGLSPRGYFETVRKARAAVTIPSQYRDLTRPLNVTPDAVTEAFVKANPGLTPNGIAVECSRKRLSEVRLCLSKQLQFRDCPDVARRSCRSDQLTMPPVRGG